MVPHATPSILMPKPKTKNKERMTFELTCMMLTAMGSRVFCMPTYQPVRA